MRAVDEMNELNQSAAWPKSSSMFHSGGLAPVAGCVAQPKRVVLGYWSVNRRVWCGQWAPTRHAAVLQAPAAPASLAHLVPWKDPPLRSDRPLAR